MKKLFLHIGFNKTGSTSLQKDLALNAAALRQQGILYPRRAAAPYMQGRQHVPLAAAVPERDVRWLHAGKRATRDQAYEALFADLRGEDFETLVLSSESFGGLDMDARKVAWIRDRFADYEIHAVAYIRRQDGYFLSTYQQGIKGGATRAFDFASYRSRPALKFAARLDLWRQGFGAGRVHVRPFEPRLWPGRELLHDFLDTIGAQRGGITPSKPENEGLDYRAVELLRQLNIQSRRGGRQARPGGRRAALALVRNFEQFMPAGFSRQKMQLSTAQAGEMRAFFRADNEAALAGTGIDPDDFFPAPPEGREACLPPATLPPQLLVKLIAGLAPAALPADDADGRAETAEEAAAPAQQAGKRARAGAGKRPGTGGKGKGKPGPRGKARGKARTGTRA
jgi:hypothetical protein